MGANERAVDHQILVVTIGRQCLEHQLPARHQRLNRDAPSSTCRNAPGGPASVPPIAEPTNIRSRTIGYPNLLGRDR